MKVTITVDIPEDLIAYVARGIMENFPEASSGSALQCTGWFYPEAAPVSRWQLAFEDGETGKLYMKSGRDFERAFPLLFSDKWPVAAKRPPVSSAQDHWDDWLCACDADDFDRFAQLVCLGGVIYG